MLRGMMMLLKVVCWGGVIAAIREAETWRDPEREGKKRQNNLDRFFGGDKSFSARLRGWPNRLELLAARSFSGFCQ
jgi:hypothetical protein